MRFPNYWITNSFFRCPEILKDRDLTGELKDIWGAVQAKRERDKDGQQPAATPLYGAPSYYRYSNEQNGSMTYVEFGPEANGNKPDEGPHLPPTVSAVPIATPAPPPIQLASSSNIESIANGAKASGVQSRLPVATKTMSAPIATVESVDDTDSDKQLDKEPTSPSLITPTDKSNTKSEKSSNASTKKDKLVGFLPNGCHNIFPFIKSKNGTSKKDKKAAKDVAAAKSASAGSSSPVKLVLNGNHAENGSDKSADGTKHEPFVVGNGKRNESNGMVLSNEEKIVVDKMQKIKL